MNTKVVSLSLVLITFGAVLTAFVNQPNVNRKSKVAERLLLNLSDADTYRVIKVNGKILYIRNGKDMIQGDVFSPKEKLKFKTTQSRAAVISKLSGRKILSPKGTNTSKATLLPAMNNISSRSGALINMIDLQNHFSGKYLILDEIKLKISNKSFPMNESSFFFMRYEYNGETINKKLNFEEDHLIISKSELFKIDGKPIDHSEIVETTLYYRADGKSTKINTFNPVFPETDLLKSELEIIVAELKGKSESEKIEEIKSYLNEYYGKPQEDNLNAWLDSHLN